MYAVASQVAVRVIYRSGEVKVRYLWHFRTPARADLEAVVRAEAELVRLLPRWEAADLVPNEPIGEGEKTREPRNAGMYRWSDLFLPRQLLTNVTILEEIRAAQDRARRDLPPDQAEAVAVYLALMISKVVNYNSVNTFWNYIRRSATQTFARHDFAFRPAFCEFEGAREVVNWAHVQITGAYEELAGLIHRKPVGLTTGRGEDDSEAAEVGSDRDESDEIDAGYATRPPNRLGRDMVHPRPEVIVPSITCEDAAALAEPAPGSVHLICVDPPYYNNVQYSELSNFFYVWLKRALRDWPGLAHLLQPGGGCKYCPLAAGGRGRGEGVEGPLRRGLRVRQGTGRQGG